VPNRALQQTALRAAAERGPLGTRGFSQAPDVDPEREGPVSYADQAMAVTAEEILELVRQLPPRERLKVVERIHEVASAEDAAASPAEPRAKGVTEGPAIYQDLSDEEFDEFMETVRRNRREQPLRTPR
jgi:hypothetical protein